MKQTVETGTLRDFLAVLKKRRVLVIAATLAAVGASVAYSAVKEPTYTAISTISFEDPSRQASSVLGQAQADFFPTAEPAAGAEFVTSSKVISAVAEEPDVSLTMQELRDSVQTEVQTSSNLVEIETTSDDAKETAAVANAFARLTKEITRTDARDFFRDSAKAIPDDPLNDGIKERLQSLAAVADPVQIVRSAEVPSTPISPRPVRDGIIAGILGLLVGVGLAFLRESLDRRFNDSHGVQRELGLPLVGQVRNETLGMVGWSSNGRSGVDDEDLEAFRILRTNVDFLAAGEEPRVVAVTSALPEEGKSTVAALYAYANAVAGRRTLLIECDFRRPVMADRLALSSAPGLGDYLTGEANPSDILSSVAVEGPQAVSALPVIRAGEAVLQPAEMIGSTAFREFLGQVSRAYELVVIDSAPLLPVGDTLELLPQVDVVLFCVRLNQTTRDEADAATAALQHLPAKPTGIVVTGVQRGGDDDYYGYYSYSPTRKLDGVAS